MADPQRRFEVVDLPDSESGSPAVKTANALAISGLTLALRALSQRAVAAVRDIFTLLSVGSAFWLWNSIANPTVLQIVSLSLYALFILAANVIIRKT